MFASYSSKAWFRSYSRALFESDPALARLYIRDATVVFNQCLCDPVLDDEEREAIGVAIRYLDLSDKAARSEIRKRA